MDGRAWWATVHGVAKSRTRLSNFTFTGSIPSVANKCHTYATTKSRASAFGLNLDFLVQSKPSESRDP